MTLASVPAVLPGQGPSPEGLLVLARLRLMPALEGFQVLEAVVPTVALPGLAPPMALEQV